MGKNMTQNKTIIEKSKENMFSFASLLNSSFSLNIKIIKNGLFESGDISCMYHLKDERKEIHGHCMLSYGRQ